MKKQTTKKHLQVVAAIIKKNGKYLCMQRCRSHYPYISEHWEFPGGKTENGESDYDTLIREIKEEMDWDIYVGKQLGEITYEYPDFIITLKAYDCKAGNGQFKMLAHLDYKWLSKRELKTLNWTDADRELLALL